MHRQSGSTAGGAPVPTYRTQVTGWVKLTATVGAGRRWRSPHEFKEFVRARLGRLAEAQVTAEEVVIESVKTWNESAGEWEPDSSSPSH